MHVTFRIAGGVISLWCLAVIFAGTSGSSAAAQFGIDPNQGLEIIGRSCTSCHDMRPIETTATDSEGWLEIINQMVDNGAEIETIERLVLLDYLVRNHGPVPEGEGRDLLLNRCTICHDLSRVRAHQGTRVLWEDAVQTMRNEGAYLEDPEYAVLIEYLVEHFGREE
jgi:hypothetical protein